MAAAMAATSLPGGLAAMPQPYQRRALRALEKREPTDDDRERIAKAEEKRARKNAKRARQTMNFVILSGEVNPLNLDASERRFMVVMDDVEPSNGGLEDAAHLHREDAAGDGLP
jgi:hypothetical protein